MSACECPACHRHFSSLGGFDRHQQWDRQTWVLTCLDPASIGMVRNTHGRWAMAPDPSKPNPFRADPDVIRGIERVTGETYHTRTGWEITDEMIDAWAAEAQRGYCTVCWKPSPCARHEPQ